MELDGAMEANIKVLEENQEQVFQKNDEIMQESKQKIETEIQRLFKDFTLPMQLTNKKLRQSDIDLT